MTSDELFEFDLNGFLVCPNVLTPAEVERVRQLIRESRENKLMKFTFMDLDPWFLELIERPAILNRMEALLGPWLRFDHAYGIRMRREVPIEENLHGGPLGDERSFFYQYIQGQMHNGMLKATFALNDVRPGDGGFICLPGSHKSNIKHRVNFDSPLVANPAFRAGDVLIFNEALIHGSRQWRAEQLREVLIYTYAPGFACWRNPDELAPLRARATSETQRRLLRPPFVGELDLTGAAKGSWTRWRTPIIDR
ncbi:MAG TPA: phytanoyl-CoA dioxygenase family protein [Burkholderiales bacterium]|nr:phytanoyl-CoA dioxygenase family protein [Burkholderiales bacterium]